MKVLWFLEEEQMSKRVVAYLKPINRKFILNAEIYTKKTKIPRIWKKGKRENFL